MEESEEWGTTVRTSTDSAELNAPDTDREIESVRPSTELEWPPEPPEPAIAQRHAMIFPAVKETG